MAATNQGQQAEHEQCVICFDDILPNQPIGQCSQCVLQTHRNCLLRWLITRQQRKLTPNCPYCRADMSETLRLLLAQARAGDPDIEQATQNDAINNFTLDDIYDSDSDGFQPAYEPEEDDDDDD